MRGSFGGVMAAASWRRRHGGGSCMGSTPLFIGQVVRIDQPSGDDVLMNR